MDHEKLHWQKNKLFLGISEEELQIIGNFVQERNFSEYEFILREGEKGKELYVIEDGHVEVLKEDAAEHQLYRIALLHTGAAFGEMVFFGKKVRTASIRTLARTKVLEVSISAIEEKHPDIALKILNNFAHHFASRLEETNQHAVLAAKKLILKEKKLNEMSRLSFHVFVILVLYQILVSTLFYFTNLQNNNASMLVEMPLIIAVGLFCLHYVKEAGPSLSSYGLTMANWKKSIGESLLVTGILMVILIGIKWAAIHLVPAYSNLPVFRIHALPTSNPGLFSWEGTHGKVAGVLAEWSMVIYLLSTPIQEFIFRGVVQTSLQKTLAGRNRIKMAILLSNVIFAGVHEPLFWLFPIAVFIPGLIWGWLYFRHRTLIGVCLSHLILGFWAFYVVGFPFPYE